MITPLLMKIRKLFYSLLWVVILWITNYASANDMSFVSVYSWNISQVDLNKSTFEPKMYSLPNWFDASAYSWICVYIEYSFTRPMVSSPSKSNAFSASMPHAEYWSNNDLIGQSFFARVKDNNAVVDWVFNQLHCFDYRFEFIELPFSVYVVNPLSNWVWYFDYFFYDYKFYKPWSSTTSVDCSQDSNYLQCLENLNVANWQVATLSWSLNTCQSDLSSCQNGVDVGYQSCIENLSWCNADKTNLTNYNDSLSQQLNECLAELPIPCEWTGCEETIVSDQRFSFFRENEWERYSLPVANNVFLPQWLRAYVDSGVVAITRIQEKSDPVLSEWSFSEVNSLFFHFFKTVIIVLFFALFLRFIKALIYPLFIPKNKE